MSLQLHDDVAVLAGAVTVEEVEPLVEWLRGSPGGAVDLAGCTHLHTAALQALVLFRPGLAAPPTEPFLADHILPYLTPAEPPGAMP